MRSFVFIERISEVTDVFARERDFKAVSDAISKDAGVADISGYTDYGRVWSEFASLVEDDLHPRATVIVLGDARTNGRDPRADIFAPVAAKAGREVSLDPGARLRVFRVLDPRPARGIRQAADAAGAQLARAGGRHRHRPRSGWWAGGGP